MAASRPILLALLGAVLAVALFMVTVGTRQADDGSEPTAKSAEKGTGGTKAVSTPSGSAAKGAARAPAARRARTEPKAEAPTGVPARMRQAIERRRTVVLLVHQRGAADDDATARAVDSLRGRKGVEVFSTSVSRVADYGAVTGGLGVTRAPAVVIIGKAGNARLIEGFVDRETLAQEVADVR